MINIKSGPIYTLCLTCSQLEDPLPALNPDHEPCDSCGDVPKQITFLDHIPCRDKKETNDRAVAKAILRGLDKRPQVKVPRR